LTGYPVSTTFRVDYADTDGQGRVLYQNYFRFFDRGRFAYWERLGLSVAEIKQLEHDTVMVEVHCTYRAPAGFYDEVSVWTRVARVGRSSMRMEFAIRNDSAAALMAEGYVVLVNIELASNQAVPFRPEFKARIAALEGRSVDD
jgi:acyl-CoA thioester hydrolase